MTITGVSGGKIYIHLRDPDIKSFRKKMVTQSALQRYALHCTVKNRCTSPLLLYRAAKVFTSTRCWLLNYMDQETNFVYEKFINDKLLVTFKVERYHFTKGIP